MIADVSPHGPILITHGPLAHVSSLWNQRYLWKAYLWSTMWWVSYHWEYVSGRNVSCDSYESSKIHDYDWSVHL